MTGASEARVTQINALTEADKNASAKFISPAAKGWNEAVAVMRYEDRQTANDLAIAFARHRQSATAPLIEALEAAREALASAPIIGRTESADAFACRQNGWLMRVYSPAITRLTAALAAQKGEG